jgi:hypothetical protein
MNQFGLPSSLINSMIEGWHTSCSRVIAQAPIGHLNAVDSYSSVPVVKVPRGSLPVFGNPGTVFGNPGIVFGNPGTPPTLLGPEVLPALALDPEVPPLLNAGRVPAPFTPYILLIFTEVIDTSDTAFAAVLVCAGVLFAVFVVEVFSCDESLLLPLSLLWIFL